MTKRYVFFTSIFSFILTVIWIASNVYHSHATSTIEPLLQIQIQEISPTFDENALADLKQRSVIQPSEGTLLAPVLITEVATDEAAILQPEPLEAEPATQDSPPEEIPDEIPDQIGETTLEELP